MSSNGFFSLTGFSILIIVGIVLFIGNLAEATKFAYGWVLIGINLVALAGLAQVMRTEYRTIFTTSKPFALTVADGLNFTAVVLGSIITFQLSTKLNLGPVTAAGLIGLAAALLVPRQAVPVYCGAFVGMSCPLALQCHYSLAGAGILAGLLFVIARDTLNGFGGKLGTIAFFGTGSVLFIAGSSSLPGAFPGWPESGYIILFSILAAVATFFINVELQRGPVMASALVGIIGGLLLPLLSAEFGATLGVIVICASFAGMSSKERIANNFQMILVGLLAGLFFIQTLAFFPGAGGKLGTIAFIACIAVRGGFDFYGRGWHRLRAEIRVQSKHADR